MIAPWVIEYMVGIQPKSTTTYGTGNNTFHMPCGVDIKADENQFNSIDYVYYGEPCGMLYDSSAGTQEQVFATVSILSDNPYFSLTDVEIGRAHV